MQPCNRRSLRSETCIIAEITNIMPQAEYLEISVKTNVVSVIGADNLPRLSTSIKTKKAFGTSVIRMNSVFLKNRSSKKKRRRSHILLPQLFQNRYTSVMSLILTLESILLKLGNFATLASKMDS